MTDSGGSPSRNIGDSVIFENDAVRIWELRLPPGAASSYHRHELDYFFLHVMPSQIEVTRDDGSTEESVFEAGYVQFVNVGRGTEHQIRNTAADEHLHYIVELKAANERAPSGDNGRRTLLSSAHKRTGQ
jgi:beta-alanine degradation protein BauB